MDARLRLDTHVPNDITAKANTWRFGFCRSGSIETAAALAESARADACRPGGQLSSLPSSRLQTHSTAANSTPATGPDNPGGAPRVCPKTPGKINGCSGKPKYRRDGLFYPILFLSKHRKFTLFQKLLHTSPSNACNNENGSATSCKKHCYNQH